jgi:hypothetical protein
MAEIKIVELNVANTEMIELTTQKYTEILGGSFLDYLPLPTFPDLIPGPTEPTSIPGFPGPTDPNFPRIFVPTFPE